MIKNNFFRITTLLFVIAMFSMIFVACDKSETETNPGDDGYSIIDTDGFTVYGLKSEIAVSNSTLEFSFTNKITVSNGAVWVVTLDEVGSKTVLSKRIDLSVGDNIVYIWVMSGNNTKMYTFNVHRNYIMTVIFNTNGGTPIPASQRVEEGCYVIEPEATTRSGYKFERWNFDFSQPIPFFQTKSTLTILASWIGVDYYHVTIDGIVSLTSYGKTQQSLVIPERVNDIVVTAIAERAFYGNKNIRFLDLPNTIDTIFEYAFYDCSNLSSIILPNSLINIKEHAFNGCTNLELIDFPNSLIEIGQFAFCNDVKLREYSFGENLLKIGSFAFYGTIPIAITIPENIVEIGNDAFGNNSKLQEINYNAINATAPSFLKSTTKSLNVTINIGKNVEIVPAGFAFCDFGVNYSYNHQVSLNFLGNAVIEIGSRAFYNCKISNIDLPSSLIRIGTEAFLGSQGVYNQTITIPERVEYIGARAFFYCQFRVINYYAVKADIPDRIFGSSSRCQSRVVLNVGKDVESLPQNIFIFVDFFSNNSTQYFITDLNFHEYNVITELADIMLCGASYPYYVGDLSLMTITFGRNITFIGANVFKNTKDLITVKYFGSLEHYENIKIEANNSYLLNANFIFNYEIGL